MEPAEREAAVRQAAAGGPPAERGVLPAGITTLTITRGKEEALPQAAGVLPHPAGIMRITMGRGAIPHRGAGVLLPPAGARGMTGAHPPAAEEGDREALSLQRCLDGPADPQIRGAGAGGVQAGRDLCQRLCAGGGLWEDHGRPARREIRDGAEICVRGLRFRQVPLYI